MAGSDLVEPRGTFPFVVGCQRSGTTLVQAMLDQHPDLAMPPESHFIVPLARRFANRWHPGPETNAAFADALLSRRRFSLWRLSRPELLSALAEAQPLDFASGVRAVYATWARRRDKLGYGDKTPRYVGHLHTLGGLFPEARFVHLIRDGRDVGLSMSAAFDRGPQTAVEGALFWRTAVEAGRTQGRSLGAQRYLEIRYEDLVAEPAREIAAVCQFLKIDFDERMLSPASAAPRIIAGYPSAAAHGNLSLPIKARRDWRVEMSRRDCRRFEILAGDLLSDLGYHRATEDPADVEDRRIELVAGELVGLRRDLFSSERKLERSRCRVAALERSPWGRLGRAAGRARALLRRRVASR